MVIVDGEDPGQNAAALEAYLDVELSGSELPAQRSCFTPLEVRRSPTAWLWPHCAQWKTTRPGLISVSYGECEAELGQSGNSFWIALWEQAAAQGQTVFVSAGDGGSAGCDNFSAQSAAYAGLAVNGIASTPYNVAVGGTDFYYSQYGGGVAAVANQLASYWASTSTSPAGIVAAGRPGAGMERLFWFQPGGCRQTCQPGKPNDCGRRRRSQRRGDLFLWGALSAMPSPVGRRAPACLLTVCAIFPIYRCSLPTDSTQVSTPSAPTPETARTLTPPVQW